VVPGWGAWTGAGVIPREKSQREKRRESREKQAWLTKRKDIAAGRQDALLYQLPKLPYPYTSVEQYEREMRAPIGTEWNTTQAHAQMIRPAVYLLPYHTPAYPYHHIIEHIIFSYSSLLPLMARVLISIGYYQARYDH
jgi:hypothetical protein